MIHSPFHVIDDFISPKQCDELIKGLALTVPDYAENGQPLKHERFVTTMYGTSLAHQFHEIIPELELRYSAKVSNPQFVFQQYWENPKVPAEGVGCENSRFTRKKWVKHKDVDLVGFIWLKTFHNSVPLDPRIEVYGGKIEFPAYQFSLTPVQGTLVMFPATPHFVTATSHIFLGSLEQIKITAKLSTVGATWQYVASNYPGTYQEWFFSETART